MTTLPALASIPWAPSPQVRSLVESIAPKIVQRAHAIGMVALAVVGSAARGEETWQDNRLVGDIDLAAIVRSSDPLTARRLAQAGHGLADGVGLGYFPLYSLRRYRTLEFYEAKRTAWVVWGDRDVFQQVRVESASDIPEWEALRLVLNRAMDCIRARAGLLPPWYAAVKAYLAIGEADLVFGKRYVPSYQGRWQVIAAAGRVCDSTELLERVRWATDWKLSGVGSGEPGAWQGYEAWLLSCLSELLGRYLGRPTDALAGLEVIARRNTHLAHRAAYVARHARAPRRWARALRSDPIFPIWREAIQVLRGDRTASVSELRLLLTDWERTHQPLPR